MISEGDILSSKVAFSAGSTDGILKLAGFSLITS